MKQTDAEFVELWPSVINATCSMCGRRRTTCTWTLSPSVHCLCADCLEGVLGCG